jgi:hypothetical protein
MDISSTQRPSSLRLPYLCRERLLCLFVNKIALVLSALFVVPLAVTLVLQATLWKAVRQSDFPPQQVFGSPLPANLEVILSQRTETGLYARAIFRSYNARLDVMTSSASLPLPAEELLSTLKKIKALKQPTSIAAPLISLFMAQINPLRAELLDATEISIGQTPVSVSKIKSKDDEIYYIGMFTSGNMQVGFLLLDPDNRITPALLADVTQVLAPLGLK